MTTVRGLTRTRTTEKPDDANISAFAQMGSQALDTPGQILGEKSRGVARTRTGRQTNHRDARPRNRYGRCRLGDKLERATVQVREQPSNNSSPN